MDMRKTVEPEEYSMVFCPVCSGRGKLPKNPHDFDVCEECGGFGLIKKESETPEGTEDNSPTKKAGFRNGPAFFVLIPVGN